MSKPLELTEKDLHIIGLGDGWYLSIQRGIKTKEWAELIKQQILENQDKAKKYEEITQPKTRSEKPISTTTQMNGSQDSPSSIRSVPVDSYTTDPSYY